METWTPKGAPRGPWVLKKEGSPQNLCKTHSARAFVFFGRAQIFFLLKKESSGRAQRAKFELGPQMGRKGEHHLSKLTLLFWGTLLLCSHSSSVTTCWLKNLQVLCGAVGVTLPFFDYDARRKRNCKKRAATYVLIRFADQVAEQCNPGCEGHNQGLH